MVRPKQIKAPLGAEGEVLTVQSDLSTAPQSILGTGITSVVAAFTSDISAITPPTFTTVGTGLEVQDYPDGSTTGQRFEFHVPVDYDSGNLTFSLLYNMTTSVANPNNQIQIETTAEIAVAGGTIDTASYPATAASHTTLETTLITRESFLTINEGDFSAGDVIQFFFKRLGADGSDLHTGVLRVIAYDVSYRAAIATSASVQTISIFDDTDETAPAAGTKGNFDTLDFAPSADNEQKFGFGIPDNWDESSDIQIIALFAMSTAEGSKVIRISTEGDIANSSTGALDTVAVESIDTATPSTMNVTRSSVLRTISASTINRGDFVNILFARRGSVGADTHLGNFQLLSITVLVGIAPQSGFTGIQSLYLEIHNFNEVSGTVTGEVEVPSFAGDFETYILMSSTSAAARIDVSFQGRLSDSQTQINTIKIPIIGASGAQHQIKVYAEGLGATPVFDGGLISSPTSRTVTTIQSGDLSSQPTGEGRYFIVVEATLDSAETLRVGRPFVKHT